MALEPPVLGRHSSRLTKHNTSLQPPHSGGSVGVGVEHTTFILNVAHTCCYKKVKQNSSLTAEKVRKMPFDLDSELSNRLMLSVVELYANELDRVGPIPSDLAKVHETISQAAVGLYANDSENGWITAEVADVALAAEDDHSYLELRDVLTEGLRLHMWRNGDW